MFGVTSVYFYFVDGILIVSTTGVFEVRAVQNKPCRTNN